MRKIYLIDGDNVSIKDLAREVQLMQSADKDNELIIFYNPNSCEKYINYVNEKEKLKKDMAEQSKRDMDFVRYRQDVYKRIARSH